MEKKMNYRIYKNIVGWELIDVKSNFGSMLKTVENLLNDNIRDFIVIEHDTKIDSDFPIIICEADYLFHKKEYEGKYEHSKVYGKCKLQNL